ncbi:MAG TPA: hypothetical protein VF807_04885 [Ktedonobacterales bacterium]
MGDTLPLIVFWVAWLAYAIAAAHAERRGLPRASLMAACWGLGGVSMLLTFAWDRTLGLPADSLAFAQGLSAGAGVGLLLAAILLFTGDMRLRKA